MTEKELSLDELHTELVRRCSKPGSAVLHDVTSSGLDLLHGSIGVSGEAGELLDAVKKHVIYDKPLDVDNVVEELGDIEFYLRMVRLNIGVTREETLVHNIRKLNKRYPTGYTNAAAQARADKADGNDQAETHNRQAPAAPGPER